MVDDDDFYLRIKMSGAKYCQLFETAVYHMPSKSVRKREDNEIDINPQYIKSIRNFIRKWGINPMYAWDNNRDMVIPPKYDIGFVVKNCNYDALAALEPWCSTIYVDTYAQDYIDSEQSQTLYDLNERIYSIDAEKQNDIEVRFEADKLTKEDFEFIQKLPFILNDSGKIGSMEYGIFEIFIKDLNDIVNKV